MSFGDNLRTLRQSSGVRIDEVCSEVGFKKSYLMHLEKGIANAPSPEVVVRLCRALKLKKKEAQGLLKSAMDERKTIVIQDLPEELRGLTKDQIVKFYLKGL